MLPLMHLSGRGVGQWTLTLSAREANVNIKTKLEALYGSMSSKVDAVVTVASGVEIYSTSNTNPAMTTGTGWPSGSTLKIVNLGKIRGKGGDGDNADASTPFQQKLGGNALDLGINTTIDNAYGYIFSGGGGGGAGGIGETPSGANDAGGGGGGQGDDDSSGGLPTGGGAQAGGTGTAAAPGAGGPGDPQGGSGGRGGYWGEYGANGTTGSGRGDTPNGGGGGAPGNAVKKNGKSVTWIAGNNSTRVRGAVS